MYTLWLNRICGALRVPVGEAAGGGDGASGSPAPVKAASGESAGSQPGDGPTNAGDVHSTLAERFGQRPARTQKPDKKKPNPVKADDSQQQDGDQQDDSQADDSGNDDDQQQGDDSEGDDSQQQDGDQQDDSQGDDSGENDDQHGDDSEGDDTQKDDGETEDPEKKPVPYKRFRNVIQQRDDARTEATTAKADATKHLKTAESVTNELRSLQAQKFVPRPTPEVPLTSVTSEEQLTELSREALQLRRWANANPEGGECPLFKDREGKPVQVDADKVKQWLATTDEVLTVEVPTRRKFMEEEAKYRRIVEEAIPVLKDANHPLTRAVNEVYRAFPQIKYLPSHYPAALQQALGQMLFKRQGANAWKYIQQLPAAGSSQQTQAQKKTTPAKTPPAPTGRSAAPRQSPGTQKNTEREKLESGKAGRGDVRSLLAGRFGGGRAA